MTTATTTQPTRRTVAVQHPAMSEALIMDTDTAHTDTFLRNAASFYVLRHFDEMLPAREFTIADVDPSTTTANLYAPCGR